MQNNIVKHIIFLSQISFFALLIGSAVTLALTSKTSVAEVGIKKQYVQKNTNYQIKSAPWYGSVSTGMYINDPNFASVEAQLDHKLSVVSWFVHWDTSIKNEKLTYACSNGYVPQITWESRKDDEIKTSSYTLDDIINGTYDTFITAELTSIKDTCKNQPVIIRFDHEMDTMIGRTSWYPWQGSPQKYIAAWQHVVAISHSVSPTIKWLWSPNRGVAITKQYYPGGEWVDYVGITINRNATQSRYTDFGTFYTDNQTVIESFGKPVIVGETTYDEDVSSSELKAAWIASMASYIVSNPKIVSVSWFQSRTSQSFDSSPESIIALRSAYATLGARK